MFYRNFSLVVKKNEYRVQRTRIPGIPDPYEHVHSRGSALSQSTLYEYSVEVDCEINQKVRVLSETLECTSPIQKY